MRKKNYKGRRITRKLSKCLTVFRAYDNVQNAFAEVLENDLDAPKIGTLYVQKATLKEIGWTDGKRLTVEIGIQE